MDSGVPLTPSFGATSPMAFSHFMGMNIFMFHNGMQNHDTQSIPWVSNHLPLDMPNMPSPFPSSPSHVYMNPSFGVGFMITPFFASSFHEIHIPQLTLTVGGWNLPSYRSNLSFTFPGESAQMGGYSTCYTQFVYRSPAMPFPTNTFPITDLHLSSSISYGGSQFYIPGYPLHGIPSFGGNLYPHLSNPCHDFFSLQTFDSVMMPLQTSMNQVGRGYHPVRQGHGVYQNLSWYAIYQMLRTKYQYSIENPQKKYSTP
jgi:hypothetical protein